MSKTIQALQAFEAARRSLPFAIFTQGREVTDKVLAQKLAKDDEIAVFESLRTYGSCIFRLEEHVKRFMESARTAGVSSRVRKENVRQELQAALKGFITLHGALPDEDFFLRVTWWEDQIFVMVGQKKHAPALYQEGIVLKTSPVKRTLSNAAPAEAKTSAYQNAVLASVEPQAAYEWLFLDRSGFVTEVRIGNLFIIKDKTLLTPPTQGILNGVTRRFVIECAHQLDIPVREVPVTRHEVYNADEAFLTNTSWEILPVRELDSRRIGSRIPGIITSKLQQTFKKKVQQECR
jgi:branched-chain amino acid aminotransferase